MADQIKDLIERTEKGRVGDEISKFLAPGKDVSWWNFYNKFFGESAAIYEIEDIFGRVDFSYEATQSIEKTFQLLIADTSLSRDQVATKILETLKYQEAIASLIHHTEVLQKTFGEPMQGLTRIRSSLTIKSAMTFPNISNDVLKEEELRIAGYYDLVKFLRRYETVRSTLPKSEQKSFDTWIIQAKEFATYVSPENISALQAKLENIIKSQETRKEKPKNIPQEIQKQFTTMYTLFLHPNFPGKLLKNPVDDICDTMGVTDTDFRKSMKKNPPQQAQISSIDDILNYDNLVQSIFQLSIPPRNLTMIFKKVLISGEKNTLVFLRNAVGYLSIDQIYDILEPEQGFQKGGLTLSRCIEEFGFPEKLKTSLSYMFSKYLGISKMTPTYWKNTQKLVKFFLGVESSGGFNVANYEGVSSANGYMQYLTGDGYTGMEELDEQGYAKMPVAYNSKTHGKLAYSWSKKTKDIPSRRISRQKSSYDRALIATAKSPAILEMYPKISSEYKSIGKPKSQNILGLSSQEQLVLFFSDLCAKPKNSELFINLLQNAIISGDKTSAQKLYDAHHTNTSGDVVTRRLRDKHLNTIYRDA